MSSAEFTGTPHGVVGMAAGPVLETLVLSRTQDSDASWKTDVLKGFDVLRRSISQRVHGNDGLFPGYNTLRLTGDESKVVLLTALVRRHDGRSHDVVYEAHPLVPSQTDAVDPVAYATGVTLSHE